MLKSKGSDQNYAAFFSEEQQIDVLFFGSSHIRNGIFPMELWNDYGITAYNMAGDGNRIPMAYWRFVNALDYQTPKLVVMDVYGGSTEGKVSTLWQTHLSFDCFPLSMNKYRMMRDLFDDENMEDYDKRWELLADFSIYHTRWNALNETDFYSHSDLEKKSSEWRGSLPLAQIIPVQKNVIESKSRLTDVNRNYLENMIILCQSKNIDILFINTAYDSGEESESYSKSVQELTDQYGVEYIDLTKLDIVNYETDFYNAGPNAHVNFTGAKKLTNYIGMVISSKFQIDDHREDPGYQAYWESYQNYVKSKAGYLKGQTSLDEYFMFMTDENYNAVIEIRNKDILYEESNQSLLENLGVNLEHVKEDIDFMTINCIEKDVNYFSVGNTHEALLDSNIGVLGILYDEDSGDGTDIDYKVCLNNVEIYTADLAGDGKIRIVVMDRDSGDVVDVRTF